MARYFDAVLTLLPFEAAFFEKNGLKAYFVGYPVVERAKLITGGDDFRRRLGIDSDAPLLAVLPGSRRNEIRFILPPFKKAVERLAGEIPGLVCVMPTVGHVAALVREAASDWPTPVHVVEGDVERYAAFDAADAGLAASGTVTSELALARTPMVVGYRVGRVTYALGRHFLLVPFVVLINLILDREAVPECIQAKCEPQTLARALRPLLADTPERAKQLRDLDEAIREFGGGAEAPSLRAARTLLMLAEASVRR
jgi:lipid-A-disaccharide synthase